MSKVSSTLLLEKSPQRLPKRIGSDSSTASGIWKRNLHVN